jgi:exonuclease SbcC
MPNYYESEFIKTPSREFLTLEAEDEIDWFIETGIDCWFRPDDEGCTYYPSPKDKIVRVHYTCSEETNKRLNRKSLEKALHDAGAFHVAEIKPVQVITALTKQELSENDGPLENLKAWSEREGIEEADALITIAKPMLDTVSAKMPTGKLSGVFEPKRLEVKNYRSYREEEFDFRKIFFATVNGPNGIGKSAFFMDAICDSLYEEPRSGETGSWITTSDDARSGMITFEFGMGDTDWRVIRTRAKSGKTTLALQQMDNGQWVDRSTDKVRDTQDKIISLLGMDCATFRCVALIMQDAYGLFMEADKTERMEVLANILGLNVYEQLTELAKNKVTEVGREITKAKDKLAELDTRLNTKAGLCAELSIVNSDLTVVSHDISEKERSLKEAQELVHQLTAKQGKAEDLKRQIASLTSEVQSKEQEKTKQQEQLKWAEERISREETILTKASEYDKVKEQIMVLKAKEPQLTLTKQRRSQVTEDLDKAVLSIKKLDEQIGVIETVLADRDEIEATAKEYQIAVTDLEAMDKVGQATREQVDRIRLAEVDTDRTGDDLYKQQTLLNHFQSKAETLKSKAAMLDDSNCIDPENAKCAFLADAQKAKADIPDVEKGIDEIKAEMARIEEERKPLLKIVADLEAERVALNYDSEKHYNLIQRVNELRPKAEQATELKGKAELLKTLEEQRLQAIDQKFDLIEKQTELDKQIRT